MSDIKEKTNVSEVEDDDFEDKLIFLRREERAEKAKQNLKMAQRAFETAQKKHELAKEDYEQWDIRTHKRQFDAYQEMKWAELELKEAQKLYDQAMGRGFEFDGSLDKLVEGVL